jgi:hypothetical protein
MTEENINNQEEAPVEQEIVEQQQEQPEEHKEPPKVDQEKNWREVHQVLKGQKQEIEELRKQLQERAEKATLPPSEPDEFADLDPNDIVTVSQAKKMAEKLAAKTAKEAAKEIVEQYVGKYDQNQRVSQDEQRMRSQVQDYDYVVENYTIPLIKNDPALARMVQTSKNPAETAYKLGKLNDQYEDQPIKQQTSPKAEKVMKNASRPLSSNAVGNPLKSQADEFSKMNPNEVWSMSQKYAKGG